MYEEEYRSILQRSQLIKQKEVAQAMKLCSEAGLQIKRTRIWQDRNEILSGLDNGYLKDWLRNQ